MEGKAGGAEGSLGDLTGSLDKSEVCKLLEVALGNQGEVAPSLLQEMLLFPNRSYKQWPLVKGGLLFSPSMEKLMPSSWGFRKRETTIVSLIVIRSWPWSRSSRKQGEERTRVQTCTPVTLHQERCCAVHRGNLRRGGGERQGLDRSSMSCVTGTEETKCHSCLRSVLEGTPLRVPPSNPCFARQTLLVLLSLVKSYLYCSLFRLGGGLGNTFYRLFIQILCIY